MAKSLGVRLKQNLINVARLAATGPVAAQWSPGVKFVQR